MLNSFIAVIIWRIWRVDSRSSVYFHSGSTVNQTRYLRKVMRVIAESGAVYTLMVFLTFILCITGSNALYPMSDMVSRILPAYLIDVELIYCKTLQATGIAFNVILIRSPTRRDKQFNAFEHNTRASILVDQRAVVDNTAMRSISMARQPSHPPRQAVKSLGSRARSESSASDLHSDGIVVSKTVLTSWSQLLCPHFCIMDLCLIPPFSVNSIWVIYPNYVLLVPGKCCYIVFRLCL